MADANPYDPPMADHAVPFWGRRLALALAWPLVFAFNAIFAVLIMQRWRLTVDHGQWGVAVAASLLLVGGWIFCSMRPAPARNWLMGAAVLGCGQLVPVLHIQLAWLALSVTENLRLMQRVHLEVGDQPGTFASEAGGFVFTLTFGVSLMLVAGALGMAIVAWRRWSANKSRQRSLAA